MIKISVDLSELVYLVDQLDGDIENIIATTLATEAESILRKSIMSNIYGGGRGGGSQYYMNTGSIKGAFTVNRVSGGFVIFMDESKLSAYSPNPGHTLGAYTSIDGADKRSDILQWFETGAGGSKYNRFAGIPATGYFNEAYEEMNVSLPQLLKSGLSARGWRVS